MRGSRLGDRRQSGEVIDCSTFTIIIQVSYIFV